MTSFPHPPVHHPDQLESGRSGRPWWGLGDVWIGLACSQLMAGLAAVAVLGAGGWDTIDDSPLWTTAFLALALHGTLAAVVVAATRAKGSGLVRDLALRFRSRDVGVGMATGIGAQLILVPLVTFPIIWLTSADVDDISEPATDLTDRADSAISVIVLLITVAVVAPVIEEVFFRGLVFGAFLKRRNLPWLEPLVPRALGGTTLAPRWNTCVAVVLSSMLFGAIHFQPLLFPALTAAGAVFAWLVLRYERLGPAIWAHVGFNATTLVALLA